MKSASGALGYVLVGLATLVVVAGVGNAEGGPPWARLDGNNQFTGSNAFDHGQPFGFSVFSNADNTQGPFSHAIFGIYENPGATGSGVFGLNRAFDGHGVSGRSEAVNGGIGVFGSTESPNGMGVAGAYGPETVDCCGSAALRGDSNAGLAPAGWFQQNSSDPDGWVILGANVGEFVFTVDIDGDVWMKGGLSQASSARYKNNVEPLADALETVERLRGVTFSWADSGRADIGVIAEEVAEVLPEVVSVEADSGQASGVDYGRLTAVLIEAVKEQQAQIRELRGQIELLEGQR